MAQTLDVYRDWLGIAEPARPLNHYQLLRLKQFEDEPSKVRENYRKMNAHVRKYAAGEFGAQSQTLLNELAKAMLCLTDAKRKGEYDASLGRSKPASGGRRSLEEILIGRKLLDQSQLDAARNLARSVNLDLHAAVLQRKLAKPDDVMQAYAESIGLPYVDLGEIGIDESLVETVPAVVARQHSCAPVMVDDGQLIMASPNPLGPEVEDNLRLRFNMPVRIAICTPASINEIIAKHYPKELAAKQMAGGGPAVTAAAQKSAASSTATASPAAPVTPLDAEAARKRKIMVAVVAFNVTAMAIGLTGSLTGMALKFGFLFWPLALGAGALVAGVAYLMTPNR